MNRYFAPMLTALNNLNEYYELNKEGWEETFAGIVEEMMKGIVEEAQRIMRHLTDDDGIFNRILKDKKAKKWNDNYELWDAWFEALDEAYNHKCRILNKTEYLQTPFTVKPDNPLYVDKIKRHLSLNK